MHTIEETELKLKQIDSHIKRLNTLRSKYNRRLSALKRWIDKKKPVEEPKWTIHNFFNYCDKQRLNEQKKYILELAEVYATQFAHKLKVKNPRVRYSSDTGCIMKCDAHVHLGGHRLNRYTRYRKGTVRGTICINDRYVEIDPDYAMRDIKGLMAHEVAHLTRKKRQHLGHCNKHKNIMNELLKDVQ